MSQPPERVTFRLDVGDEPEGDAPASSPTGPPAPGRGEPGGVLPDETPGRYRAAEEGPEVIGVGGIGRVLAVEDRALGREVALKELLPAATARAGSVPLTDGTGSGGPARTGSALAGRFLREARITARLEHPSIVPVYELGRREDGTLYYTMRRVRGRTLAAALTATTSLGERLALLRHVVDTCYAVAYAHSRGVVHRDLKPDNVMVGEFGETVVLDWGLAAGTGERDSRRGHFTRELERFEAASSRHTLVGTVMGTPAYMSPEQARGQIDLLDERSDIWSLGAVLYEVLCGAPPYAGPTPYDVLHQVRTTAPAPVRTRCPEVPPELAAIADKALTPDREARYPTASALAEDIEAWRSGRRVQAYTYSGAELLRRFYARHRVALTIGGVAAAALGLAGLSSHLRVREERDRAMAAEASARSLATEAQRAFADSLATRAESAWKDGDHLGSTLLAAGALSLREDPSSRGLVLGEGDHPSPTVAAILPTSEGCGRLAWSGDGARLACGGADGVRVWSVADLATAGPPVILPTQGDTPRALAFSPDSSALAVGGTRGRITRWSLASHTPTWTLTVPGLAAASAAWTGDRIAVGGRSGSSDVPWLVTVDADGGALLHAFTGEAHTFSEAVAFSEDARVLISAGWGLATLDPLTGAPLAPPLRPGHVAIAMATHGERRAVAWQGQEVTIEDPGELRLPMPDAFTRHLAFSPDGAWLAGGSSDGFVRLWDTTTGAELTRLPGYDGRGPALAFSPDGRHLAAGAEHAPVRVWDLAPLRAPPPPEVPTGAFTVAPDASAVTWVDHGSVVFADPATLSERRRSAPLSLSAPFTAWVGGGHAVWVLLAHGDIGVVAADTGGVTTLPAVSPARVVGVARAPGGGWVAVHDDGALARYDAGGARGWSVTLPRDEERGIVPVPVGLAIAPDGGALLVACTPGLLLRVDPTTGAVADRQALPGLDTRFAAFSPDGAEVAMAGADEAVHVYQTGERREVARLEGHAGALWSGVFSADGARLLTVSGDETARVWRVADATEVLRVGRPGSFVWQGGFTPDGAALYTAGNGPTLRRWDLAGLTAPGSQLLADVERRLGLSLRGAAVVPTAAP